MDIREHIKEAIRLAGTETKLGEATGYSQHAIWKAKTLGKVTGEMAVAIDRATSGAVSKALLRPDLFGDETSTPPTSPESPAPEKAGVASS